MCYEASQLAYRIYKDAERLGASKEELEILKKKWHELERDRPQFYHVSGYEHPKLIGFEIKSNKIDIAEYVWGLIPDSTKDEAQAKEIWNKTLNARSETIFDKPAFKKSAEERRIVIPLTGFFEHHHKKNKTFPYFIKSSDNEDLLVAGVASEWVNKESGEIITSASIVTTKGNEMMATIHNNPKLKEARMPLILNPMDAKKWMESTSNEAKEICQYRPTVDLESYTVGKLRGNDAVGNCEEAHDKRHYVELDEPPTLF